jgi:hypothetical protein
MAAVLLDIEKVFDKTWHPGLLYIWSEFKFSISLINLISPDWRLTPRQTDRRTVGRNTT